MNEGSLATGLLMFWQCLYILQPRPNNNDLTGNEPVSCATYQLAVKTFNRFFIIKFILFQVMWYNLKDSKKYFMKLSIINSSGQAANWPGP